MKTLAINSPNSTQQKLGKWILAGLTVALFFSAPAVNFFEAILIIYVLSSEFLRTRLIKTLQSPLCMTAIIFYAVIIMAATYSIAPTKEAWGMVSGWRKIIILPFACAAIFNANLKNLILKTFLITSTACLALSFCSFYFPSIFVLINPPGIIIKNHATQGIFFGIAILISLIFLTYQKITWPSKTLLQILIGLFFFNIATITIGRSGYVAMTVLTLGFTIYQVRHKNLINQILVIGLVATLIAGTFYISKTSRERINLGINEFTQLKTEGDAGSMGVRHYWWMHSLNMIKKNPVTGIGTGAFEEGLNQETVALTGPAATKTNDPHNQFLKILVEQGIIGFIIFMSVIVSAFISLNVSEKYRLLGLLVLISWCATSLANSHFSTFHEGHFIWFWLGAMLAPEK